MVNNIILFVTLFAGWAVSAGQCPFASTQLPPDAKCERRLGSFPGSDQVMEVCYDAVKEDLKALMTQSKDFWPADFGNYGPLFIRLAWHCAGSHRDSDGRGGCDGGNIRYNPERSWPDNGNLDKALLLLEPIKQKFGNGLSWGDLIVLSGNVAIESMGGPIMGFCGGRVDNKDGRTSLVLGPTPEQAALYPCPVNGNCSLPYGPTTVGLIYVNPGGHMGDGNPIGLLPDIRRTFHNMGQGDYDLVALIGGGHAFGKAHGACPGGPGPDPIQSPSNPWPGTCGTGPMKGKGPNAATSGFEGPWTTTPTQWSNEYFRNLLRFNWTKTTSPAGNPQFKSNNPGAQGLMMLPSDIAFLYDPVFKQYVELFANNLTALNQAFAYSWYKLTTADMGPHERCKGMSVPPPQDFQMPLPLPIKPYGNKKPNVDAIAKKLTAALTPAMTLKVVHLAYQCASPFRITDYLGGCNGARIRFSPQKDWPWNVGNDETFAFLAPFKQMSITWADLIVLAGKVGLEKLGGNKLGFKFGRRDALNGDGMQKFAPRKWAPNLLLSVRDNMQVMGLSPEFAIALAGRPRDKAKQIQMGYSGSYGVEGLSNDYFKILLGNTWEFVNNKEYKAVGKDDVYMMPEDLALIWDMEFREIVEQYASDNTYFKTVFAAAWDALMTADSFSTVPGVY